MTTTVQEIYTQVLKTLSPTERLRLATLILNDLVLAEQCVTDQSHTWTEQDQIDLAAFSLQYAGDQFFDDEGMIEVPKPVEAVLLASA